MMDRLMKFVDKCIAGLVMLAIVGSIVCLSSHKSDNYIRARIVKLTSARGQCTGEQIQAPSHKAYIISAGHCMSLVENGEVTVTTEDGKTQQRKVIAEDPNSDLMLIEGIPGLKGLEIAASSAARQEIRSFTHGHGYNTYKTDGVIIQDEQVQIAGDELTTDDQIKACLTSPKHKIGMSFFGAMCILDVLETVHTAKTVPGSSGGALVDAKGDLVGVCSAGSADFNLMVTLKDIKAFLAKY